MAYEFRMSRRMQFAETDMAGIVHFSNFFRFMEETEHAFFRSLGLEIHGTRGGHMFGWVRVHAECDYSRPARYMDELDIQLSVRSMTSKSIDYEILFRLGAADGLEEKIARGEMRVVHVCKGPDDERMRAREMPADVARLIEVSPHHST